MSNDERMIYRTIAQSVDGLTITANSDQVKTMEQFEQSVVEHVLPERMQETLKKYVTLPIATRESWENRYVNFCPRCGIRFEEADSSTYDDECHECGAIVYVEIHNLFE